MKHWLHYFDLASCHNIDTTPLESLPGNIDLLKQVECNNIHTIEKNDNIVQESHGQCDNRNNSNINNMNTIVHNRNNNIRISSGNYIIIIYYYK